MPIMLYIKNYASWSLPVKCRKHQEYVADGFFPIGRPIFATPLDMRYNQLQVWVTHTPTVCAISSYPVSVHRRHGLKFRLTHPYLPTVLSALVSTQTCLSYTKQMVLPRSLALAMETVTSQGLKCKRREKLSFLKYEPGYWDLAV